MNKIVFRASACLVLPELLTLCAWPQSGDSRRGESPDFASCPIPSGNEPWRSPSLSPECRTLEVIHAMSLSDKINTIGFSYGPPQPGGVAVPATKAADGPNGIARGPFPGPPPPMAVGVTAFPNEIVAAASWDTRLAADFGKALGEEWSGKGLNELLGPTLNIMRTWHWGRSAETYGEDPFLTGQMAAAEIEGIQSQHSGAFRALPAHDRGGLGSTEERCSPAALGHGKDEEHRGDWQRGWPTGNFR